jgi:glycosyltransferase involved in cell wall biosynthesis
MTEALPSLTVAVATTGARVAQIALPPPAPGIDYLIHVQAMGAGPLPDALRRDDVTLRAEPGTGLSVNRNAGLAQAGGALVLFSDDDIALAPEGLAAMRAAFASDPALDLVLGWRAGQLPDTGPRRARHALTRFNTGRAAVPGIVIRRASLQATGLRFDEGFGVGAPCPLGEDYIFVTDLLAAGLRGVGLPIVTGAHDGPSSGDNWHDPLLIKSRAAVLRRVFGPLTLPVRLAYAWRHRARFGSLARMLRFGLRGL